MKNPNRIKKMRPALWGTTMLLAMGLIAPVRNAFAADGAAAKPSPPAKTRVGVYNSRAVALAYYRSKDWQAALGKVRRERQQAEAAGDKKRVAELAKWGEAAQDRAHQQTFGDAPIDNILTAMTNSLPQIKKQANVQRMTAIASPDPSVELVDVTSLIIEQFHPDEKTLKLIENLKKQPPLGADQLPHKD